MRITRRDALTAAEASRLAALYAAAFSDDGRGWTSDEIAALVPPGLALVAEDGFALISVAGDEAELLTLAVAPEARRKGRGRALTEAAMGAARASGAAEMFLEVAADNTAARALYEALGFGQVGARKGYYRRADGRMDAMILRRTL